MIQLLLMAFIGILLLCFALFALGRKSRTKSEDCSDSEVEVLRMLRLGSLEFDATILFSDTDYRLLASEPQWRSLARELRKDRRDIALDWLRELQKDVFSMWRFRSFLTRLGVTVGMRNDLSEAFRSLLLLSLLCVVRVSVRLLGPYAFGKTAVTVRTSVENLKRSCVATLSNLPRERWPQIAAEWQRVQAL
ncbi:MAG: hypothetical protein DMG50_00280 [Acidobacteria bacterium]|nr:MAG: hypothetical protein DMG50_00280 [Acidobacteriota bacterium]